MMKLQLEILNQKTKAIYFARGPLGDIKELFFNITKFWVNRVVEKKEWG